jgi:hypothetical protein
MEVREKNVLAHLVKIGVTKLTGREEEHVVDVGTGKIASGSLFSSLFE